jgi:hypothetical protein
MNIGQNLEFPRFFSPLFKTTLWASGVAMLT